MAKRIEIIGQAIVITDTVTSIVDFDAPKSEFYYKPKPLNNDSIIELYNIDLFDNVRSRPRKIKLSDAVNSSGASFTKETFSEFCRQNLGFKSGGGSGSGAAGFVISQNVNQYGDLVAGTEVNQLSYVRVSQGTAWLPYTLGGTYRPKGWYIWDGSNWVSDRNAIANALDELYSSIPTPSEFLSEDAGQAAIVGSDGKIFVPESEKQFWDGTQAEYDAILTKDPNTYYFIIP